MFSSLLQSVAVGRVKPAIIATVVNVTPHHGFTYKYRLNYQSDAIGHHFGKEGNPRGKSQSSRLRVTDL